MQPNRQTSMTVVAAGKPRNWLPAATVVKPGKSNRQRDSLAGNFNEEIDAWARMALARNGFGDLPG
jgi:hypothetical protein